MKSLGFTLLFMFCLWTTPAWASCPSGYYPCGSEHCVPNDGVCCASVGLPEYYCPGGTECRSTGECVSPGYDDYDNYDDTDDYDANDDYDNGGTYSSGDEYCSWRGSGQCTMEYCLSEDDPCTGRYIVDGRSFYCDACSSNGLELCAEEAANYCYEGGDDSAALGGCQAIESNESEGLVLGLLIGCTLLVSRRRRQEAAE